MAKLGIVKNYLKFNLVKLFGVIGCEKSNICLLPNKSGNLGTLCMAGFAEDVFIWNMKTNEIVETIHGQVNDKVTFLSYFNSEISGLNISVGYESGYVSVYSLWKFEKLIHLKCHKHSISYIIHCKPYGERIICGSKDTSITVIDIQEQTGFELKGHNSPITKLHYIPERDILISSCQKGNIKFWTLDERHCFKTISNEKEAWDFHYLEAQNLLITGSSDAHIRLWKLEFAIAGKKDSTFDIGGSLADIYSNLIQATYLGSVVRDTPKRIVEMKIDHNGAYLACNTAEKKIELYKIVTEKDLKKRLQKKTKKAACKNVDAIDVTLVPEDRLKLVTVINAPNKCKSIDMFSSVCDGQESLEFLFSMHNNTVATMHLDLPYGKEVAIKEQVTKAGHRTAVIYAQFTFDRMGLLTVSLTEAKMWEMSTFRSLFTVCWSQRDKDNAEEYRRIYEQLGIDSDHKLTATCGLLLPGDRHAVIGFKNGAMFVYSLLDGQLVQALKGHSDHISTITTTADRTSLYASSVDKSLTCWKIEYGGIGDMSNKADKGGLQLVAAEDMGGRFKNGISCVAASPDGKLVILGFMDNIVRTYRTTDTAHRILDLHQHKQPVTSISVKHDSSQLLTGSSDKLVVAWNLPNGDMKMFRGHMAPVTDVQYVPGRSMAFSTDQSGLIIMIDTRNMSEVTRLRGHGTHVTRLAIRATGIETASNGDEEQDEDQLGDAELVSVSTDGSIRLWEEGEEILVKEIEDEEEMERQHEKNEMVHEELTVVGAPRRLDREQLTGAVTETNILTKKTLTTEKCCDALIEAMDIYDKMKSDPRALADPVMTARKFDDPELFMLDVLRSVKSGDLEMVLAQLPLNYVSQLLEILGLFIKKNRETLLCSRCLLFLGKMHFKYFTTNDGLVPLINSIATHGTIAIQNYEDLIGFNTEAFDYFQTELGPELLKFTERRSVAKSKSKSKKNLKQ